MVRLKKRSEFLAAAKGTKIPRRGFVLQVLDHGLKGGPVARFGFTVTKKVGNAVVRNRVKRRLRALVREAEVLSEPGHDYVLIGRRGTLTEPYSALLNDFRQALHRVSRDKRKRSQVSTMEGLKNP
ncbi:ribonuclease P protein component [Coralliovum pocilloporae]|uniref:ribonuclease P protein component n=1 Tax=Coralliovum pocilloporae TaxID=3066369 RepID=UPI00330709D9